jgi:hypothetical protein
MPVVNGKEFPYTKKGMAAAKAEKEKGSGEKQKLKTLQEFQATRSTKPDYMEKMAKMTALKRELASRKAKAEKSEARKPGESAAAQKKRVAKSRYGNPVE